MTDGAGVRAVFHSGLVQLRMRPGVRRRVRRAAAIRKLGGACEVCGVSHPAVLEFHHANRNAAEHNHKLAALGLSLAEWITREENPRAGRFAVRLLCLNCHRIEHSQEKH